MNPERTSAWGDGRLDQEFREIREELHELRPLTGRVAALVDEQRAFRDLPARLADLATEFRYMRKDVTACFDAIRIAEEKRAKREEEQRVERKSDRRWMVGSALTAASLVIASLALLAGRF